MYTYSSMKHSLIFRSLGYVLAVAVAAVAISVAGVLLSRISELTSQVETLEQQTSSLRTELASYTRTLCSNEHAISRSQPRQHFTLRSMGLERTYQVHTPKNYDPSVRYPVILSFDGMEGSAARMKGYAGLDELPALVVYLDALPGARGFSSWEGAPYSVDGGRDVEFVKTLIETLPLNFCVDETQVFAVGMSNGGAFATIVGCELGDTIKAVASVSGAYYSTCKREQRTPSLLVLHSTSDQQVPFEGSVARHLPHVQQWVNEQARARQCKAKGKEKREGLVYYQDWHECDDMSLLRFVTIQKQEHGWLSVPYAQKTNTPSTAEYIWQFFEDARYYS